MMQVDIEQYGPELLKYAEILQSGQEDMIVFTTEDGRPIVKMVLCDNKPNGGKIKIGIAKGELNYHGDFDECNDEIAEMFGVV